MKPGNEQPDRGNAATLNAIYDTAAFYRSIRECGQRDARGKAGQMHWQGGDIDAAETPAWTVLDALDAIVEDDNHNDFNFAFCRR